MTETKPDNAPEHCPGTESDQAGKSSACAGCPNQNVCASGKILVDSQNKFHNC